MHKLISLLKYDLKCLLTPSAAFVLLAPMIIAVSVYLSLPEELFTRGTIEPFNIAISDNESDMATQLILSTLRELDLIDDVRIVTRERGLNLLEQGYVTVFVDIPIGLEESLIHNIPAEIRVYGGSDYPIQSTVIRATTDGAAGGVSAVQSVIYVFNELALPFYDDVSDFVDARNSLAIDLMLMSLGRGRAVEVVEPASTGYLAHLFALIVFVSAGVAAVYVSINTAEQHKSRSVASMRMVGLGFCTFAVNKCVQTVIFSVIAMIPPMIFATFAGIGGFAPFRLVLGSVFLAVLFSLPCLLFSLMFKNPAQTALCGFGFLFCMLFVGGTFPAHLTGEFFATISGFSPSASALGFTSWAFGESLTVAAVFPLLISAVFILPARRRFIIHNS